METTSFVLGVVTVIALALGVGTVWALIQIKDMKAYIDVLDRSLEQTRSEIFSSLGQEVTSIQSNIDQVYRDIDTRFDKFENKITKKQLLKD